MNYLHWLVGISLAFVVLERLFPWRREPAAAPPRLAPRSPLPRVQRSRLRPPGGRGNGWVAVQATRLLQEAGLAFDRSPVPQWPFWVQFLVFFVLSDFLQWSVHNMLHRVPFLWTFHKVHHAIDTMDFIGNFRFHWMEIVVYKTAQWLPLALLGASPRAVFWVAVFSTFWGDLNHANLNVGLGPLGYVFNNPRMHLWHHDASDEGGVAKNFGIVLSLWDFLFGTAFWPRDRSPERLGYPGDETMPRGFLGEIAWPIARRRA